MTEMESMKEKRACKRREHEGKESMKERRA